MHLCDVVALVLIKRADRARPFRKFKDVWSRGRDACSATLGIYEANVPANGSSAETEFATINSDHNTLKHDERLGTDPRCRQVCATLF